MFTLMRIEVTVAYIRKNRRIQLSCAQFLNKNLSWSRTQGTDTRLTTVGPTEGEEVMAEVWRTRRGK